MIKIATLRNEKHLTQSKVSKDIGIARSTLAMYETNKSEPDIEMLIKIADYFEVSLDDLLGREAPRTKDKDLIERPNYDVTDKKLNDFIKLFKVMNDTQKAQTLGYVTGMLENSGVNVASILY